MATVVNAIYEAGVLKPDEPVPLEEPSASSCASSPRQSRGPSKTTIPRGGRLPAASSALPPTDAAARAYDGLAPEEPRRLPLRPRRD